MGVGSETNKMLCSTRTDFYSTPERPKHGGSIVMSTSPPQSATTSLQSRWVSPRRIQPSQAASPQTPRPPEHRFRRRNPSCRTWIFMHAAGKMKRSPSPSVVEWPGGEPLAPADGRKGAAGLVWAVEGAEPRVGQNRVKKQLRMSAVRWLCSGHRSEGSACLGSTLWELLTPARSAGLPPTAREAGQHWPGDGHFSSKKAPVAGSDDAESR